MRNTRRIMVNYSTSKNPGCNIRSHKASFLCGPQFASVPKLETRASQKKNEDLMRDVKTQLLVKGRVFNYFPAWKHLWLRCRVGFSYKSFYNYHTHPPPPIPLTAKRERYSGAAGHMQHKGKQRNAWSVFIQLAILGCICLAPSFPPQSRLSPTAFASTWQ